MRAIEAEITGELGHVLVVRLPRDVADETSAAIRREAESRLPRIQGAGLVLDFGEVALLNSIGITTLLQMQDRCRQQGVRLLLARVPDRIGKFFETLRLHKRFEIIASVDAAVAMIERGSQPGGSVAAPRE
ncbi:MAG: STAS domain-containing protein [Phycisphaerae bacterium]|nr:STAS domain-containing protein [Phycisphaerae bacterium]